MFLLFFGKVYNKIGRSRKYNDKAAYSSIKRVRDKLYQKDDQRNNRERQREDIWMIMLENELES